MFYTKIKDQSDLVLTGANLVCVTGCVVVMVKGVSGELSVQELICVLGVCCGGINGVWYAKFMYFDDHLIRANIPVYATKSMLTIGIIASTSGVA